MGKTNVKKGSHFLIMAFALIFTAAAGMNGETVKAKVRVIAASARVYLKPDASSPVLSKVPAGAILEADAKTADWFRVYLPATREGFSVTGYISAGEVEAMEDVSSLLQLQAEPEEPEVKESGEPPKVKEEKITEETAEKTVQKAAEPVVEQPVEKPVEPVMEAEPEPRLKDVQEIELARYKNGISSAVLYSDVFAFVAPKEQKTIDVLRIADRRRVAVWPGHTGNVRQLGVSPDGERLLSSSDDNTVFIWDINGLEDTIILSGPDTGVETVAMSHDGRWLAGSSPEKGADIWVWDLTSNEQPRLFKGPGDAGGLLKEPPESLNQLDFSPDNEHIVGISSGGAVILWSMAEAAFKKLILHPPDRLTFAAFSSTGGLLTGGGNCSVQISLGSDTASLSLSDLHGCLLYEVPGQEETDLSGSGDGVMFDKAAWLPDGNHFLAVFVPGGRSSGSPSRTLMMLPLSSLSTGELPRNITSFRISPAPLFSNVFFSRDGKALLQVAQEKLIVWRLFYD